MSYLSLVVIANLVAHAPRLPGLDIPFAVVALMEGTLAGALPYAPVERKISMYIGV